jgi:hypothetical protein
MLFGLVVFLVGGGIYALSSLGVNLFNLPGDFRIQTKNLTCIVPLVSSIVISLVLTVLLNILIRVINR